MATTTAGGRVPPPRKPFNKAVRGREHLTEDEVESLRRAAAGLGHHGHRDATMILLAYTHGLRASELIAVRWDQVDIKQGSIFIRRLKKSQSGMHHLRRIEIQSLKRLCPEPGSRRGHVFRDASSGGPISPRRFHQIVARAGEKARFAFPVHPHMLRHACGYKLVNDGHDIRAIQDWLGHRNIQHTVHYTTLAPDRFVKRGFWED